MSRYTFTFKKDDIFVEFTTEDRAVVERQFQIWVMNADEYVKSQEMRSYKGQTANSLNNLKPKTVTQPQPEVPPVSQQIAQATEANQAQQPFSQPYQQTQVQNGLNNAPFEQASNLLKTINTIQNENPQPIQQAMPIQNQDSMNFTNQQQIQETFVQQPISNQQPVQQSYVQKQESSQITPEGFESVLEEKIETPTFEPPKNVDQIFLNLINSKNTKDKFHYLMITAYYLTEFGKQDRFTLKQINSKLMQNVSEVIDHSMLQDAITQGFIELVPDLTGMAQVGEYRLTRQGEEFFAYRI